jgi:hypothetical protein
LFEIFLCRHLQAIQIQVFFPFYGPMTFYFVMQIFMMLTTKRDQIFELLFAQALISSMMELHFARSTETELLVIPFAEVDPA